MLAGNRNRRIKERNERNGASKRGGSRNVVDDTNVSPDGNRNSRRSTHLTDVSRQQKSDNHEAALRKELERLEAHDSQWSHPMGGIRILTALRILGAPFDPVLGNLGKWVQPEDVEDIPSMFDSYLNVNCLYYSLVGILAIETSIYLELPNPDAGWPAQWLLTLSRFCWAANGIWSIAAVVLSFHILWSIYVTPTWAKRQFVFENSTTLTAVYALGAPNFLLLILGIITGVLGHIFNQEGYTKKDWISAALGLGVGCSVTMIFIIFSGSLISQVIRPWKIAEQNLKTQQQLFPQTGRFVDQFYDNDAPNDDSNDITTAGFGQLDMPLVAKKLCAAGLTLEMLQRVNNELLLDQLLQGAGVDKAGNRLQVILFIRDAPVE